MPARRTPRVLPPNTPLHSLITEYAGTGTTIIGVTNPAASHPGIHIGDLTVPGSTHCGITLGGVPALITQVLAVTDQPDADRVAALLSSAKIDLCRMCRRCWPGADIPTHTPARCFRTDPVTPVRWKQNTIQFARLLAELDAAGAFTDQVMADLSVSMDLAPADVLELKDRAITIWEQAKPLPRHPH